MYATVSERFADGSRQKVEQPWNWLEVIKTLFCCSGETLVKAAWENSTEATFAPNK